MRQALQAISHERHMGRSWAPAWLMLSSLVVSDYTTPCCNCPHHAACSTHGAAALAARTPDDVQLPLLYVIQYCMAAALVPA
jgi:hypothetical protein